MRKKYIHGETNLLVSSLQLTFFPQQPLKDYHQQITKSKYMCKIQKVDNMNINTLCAWASERKITRAYLIRETVIFFTNFGHPFKKAEKKWK